MTSDAIASLIAGYHKFRNGVYRANEAHYRALAERQQQPKALIVGCCDSRADPAMIFSTDPGELFVVRNVANIVPPYEPDGRFHGTSAALEFGVTGLNIANIIVMGHGRCGGINALRQSLNEPASGEFLPRWIGILREVAERLVASRPDLPDADLLRLLEQRAVIETLKNLRTFPFIQEREAQGRLMLHGWFYGIGSGRLMIYDSATDAFADVPDVA